VEDVDTEEEMEEDTVLKTRDSQLPPSTDKHLEQQQDDHVAHSHPSIDKPTLSNDQEDPQEETQPPQPYRAKS